MRIWSKDNLVVISEKQAPPDFIPINKGLKGHFAEKKYVDFLFVYQETAKELGML